jgi:hypothetical protein
VPRNLDTTLAAELAKGSVRPCYLAELQFASGYQRAWTGVGPITWNGKTYSGLGELAGVGAIHESSGVQADGTTVTLNVLPSMLAVPAYPATPPVTLPRALAAGESVAWAFARAWAPGLRADFHDPPSVYNNFNGCSGSSEATQTGGDAGVINGDSLSTNTATLGWWNFGRPLEIPPGAQVTGVYPAVIAVQSGTGGYVAISYSSPATGRLPFPAPAGGVGTVQYGPDAETLAGVGIDGVVQNTLPAALGLLSLGVSFVACAVYYQGTPLANTSLLYEAVNDVRVGGRVRIWFGMLSASGALVGTPFLSFEGLIDEPSIEEGPDATRIVLALENRLRNLNRAGGRRYTASDQKLDWPNDSGFNWVELLEELSLKWGG